MSRDILERFDDGKVYPGKLQLENCPWAIFHVKYGFHGAMVSRETMRQKANVSRDTLPS